MIATLHKTLEREPVASKKPTKWSRRSARHAWGQPVVRPQPKPESEQAAADDGADPVFAFHMLIVTIVVSAMATLGPVGFLAGFVLGFAYAYAQAPA